MDAACGVAAIRDC
jgi:ketosteroid isomerase-like protein